MRQRQRYYSAGPLALVGPYSKAEAEIIKTVEPEASVVLAPTATLAVVAGYWLVFDALTTEDQARRRFAERYGHEPERILQAGPLLLVGPMR